MRRFFIDCLLILIVLATFLSFSSGNDHSLEQFDSSIKQEETIKDGNIDDPIIIKDQNDNIVAKVALGIGKGLQKVFNIGFDIFRKMLESFLG